MHDGVFATLDEVIEFYNDGGRPRHSGIDDDEVAVQIPHPLGLTAAERAALVGFLKTLTDVGANLDPTLVRVPDSVPSGLPPVVGVSADASSPATVQ